MSMSQGSGRVMRKGGGVYDGGGVDNGGGVVSGGLVDYSVETENNNKHICKKNAARVLLTTIKLTGMTSYPWWSSAVYSTLRTEPSGSTRE